MPVTFSKPFELVVGTGGRDRSEESGTGARSEDRGQERGPADGQAVGRGGPGRGEGRGVLRSIGEEIIF